MGCNQSTEANTSAGSAQRRKRSSHSGHTSQPPPTRKRTDSWANSQLPVPASGGKSASSSLSSNKQPTNGMVPPVHKRRSNLEAQWTFLWKTHSQLLIDPVDVPSVLDSLINKCINKLSSVEITWILRRVREVVSHLPTTESKIAKMVLSGSNDGRLAVEKHHILLTSVWEQILPSFPLPDEMPVRRNLECILRHFSQPDWERMTAAAKETSLEMDVNRRDLNEMPKPSSVPEQVSEAEVPDGVTFQALAAIIALSRAGTREQRLQLVFYLILPQLPAFLSKHPAGGMPVWLLEVGHDTVVSLASLTHYHYYGTAFLPLSSDELERPKFSASQSRDPVKAPVKLMQEFWSSLLDEQRDSRVNGEQDSKADTCWDSLANGKIVTDRVQSSSRARFQENCNGVEGDWTLDEFKAWAEDALDEAAVEIGMHRLFTSGILSSPALERDWVASAWQSWEEADRLYPGVGSLGGLDGASCNGHGLLYCVDRKWWSAWSAYVGWSWMNEKPLPRSLFQRPPSLSNEALIEKNEGYVPGALGSYFGLRERLMRDQDYVLVPPQVWDVLYELYGGGPPLPRMVCVPERKDSDSNRMSHIDLSDSRNDAGDFGQEVDLDDFVEQLGLDHARVTKISQSVTLYPWVLRCKMCDPSQPYRRGDTGMPSVVVMVLPETPVWRLVSELVARLPIQSYKAYDDEEQGKVRLWKKVFPSAEKGPVSRYGPWHLLSKNRHAQISLFGNTLVSIDVMEGHVAQWKEYSNDETIESIGLTDHDLLMLEFAVQSKSGSLNWPREAAAKAGKARWLNEFKLTLQGLDKDGKPSLNPPKLVGMDVDALDGSGRWYTVKIREVEIVDETSVDEDDEHQEASGSSKRVMVDFSPHGGHREWIDVESDRLGPVGRFTNDADGESPKASSNGAHNGESRTKPVALVKKNTMNGDTGTEINKICSLPGYGACGITNVGNTCYLNSAVQCISYLPMLRAYLLSSQHKASGDLNKDNPLGTGGKLLEEFAELLRFMWNAKYGERSPGRFRSLLGKLNPQFSGADQQDAQEFLSFLLDVLHEDCNRVRKKPYVEALEDEWVEKTDLSRVGEEAWRRFLRRNRSMMADVAMGQVLNTVTCPVCSFTSRNFDPFNLLSIPIPTVAEVVFQCTVFRRATPLNCPWVLNRPRKNQTSSKQYRFSREGSAQPTGPPSNTFVAEKYVVKMSRLADGVELRKKIQQLCGIDSRTLKLCRVEIQYNEGQDENTVLSTVAKLVHLDDKEGPCSQLVKKTAPSDDQNAPFTSIIAFESTLRFHPRAEVEQETGEDEASSVDDETEVEEYLHARQKADLECRFYDSDPVRVAQFVSEKQWPRNEAELVVGLRVDAKDHRGNWYAGSIIEARDELVKAADSDTGEETPLKERRVVVHFDNFTSRWDEVYTLEHFVKGTVKPLYSHSTPRVRAVEINVHHRHTDSGSSKTVYFGQPFFIHFRNDWSSARSGAHILAQASRYLHYVRQPDSSQDSSARTQRKVYEKTSAVISQVIDVLLDYDLKYTKLALHRLSDTDTEDYCAALADDLSDLLGRLPFEIRIRSSDSQNERNNGSAEESSFAFSLTRVIGNYVNTRDTIVLQWRDPPREKGGSSQSLIRAPVMYVEPLVHSDKAASEMLRQSAEEKKKRENGKRSSRPGNTGLELGACLTEFCKSQQLSLSDNWRCPRCKEYREGKQAMNLWRLPDLLTFHIKRFNMSARWHEKISTRINFPLTSLDLSEWCHAESPVMKDITGEAFTYDLIAVVNHYGSMTGGHYVATCKATSCGKEGREEVAYNFNGVGVRDAELDETVAPSTGWRIGRQKTESSQGKLSAALAASKAVTESAEPTWLQFDDEIVDQIPPDMIVSEMAYVLFYRRREVTPSNIARYSTFQ